MVYSRRAFVRPAPAESVLLGSGDSSMCSRVTAIARGWCRSVKRAYAGDPGAAAAGSPPGPGPEKRDSDTRAVVVRRKVGLR
jgi:hypothetical protein